MYKEDEELDDPTRFDYCSKVDLHALDITIDLNNIVAIAAEHGFRGILVHTSRLERLVDAINKPLYGFKDIKPICSIDYPFGDSSVQVRNYSILDAKEKGAKEIEITAPYHLIQNKDFRRLYDDIEMLSKTASKTGLKIKYVIDQGHPAIDDSVTSRLCRIMKGNKIPTISLSSGFFNKTLDHADNIIRMRDIKSKSGCDIKVYINSSVVNDIASYVKAGADILGLPWDKAPYSIHAYEDMIQKKE